MTGVSCVCVCVRVGGGDTAGFLWNRRGTEKRYGTLRAVNFFIDEMTQKEDATKPRRGGLLAASNIDEFESVDAIM